MLRAPGPERRAGGVCAQTPLLPGTLCPLNRAGTGGTGATATGTAAARTPAGTLSAAETRTETAAGGGRGGAGGAGGGDRSRTGLQPRLASNSLPTGWGDVGGRGGRSRGPQARTVLGGRSPAPPPISLEVPTCPNLPRLRSETVRLHSQGTDVRSPRLRAGPSVSPACAFLQVPTGSRRTVVTTPRGAATHAHPTEIGAESSPSQETPRCLGRKLKDVSDPFSF